MATLVNVCQRMISSWSIWYTDRYSLSTLSPLKRVHFIIWKHMMRKGYMVILMYHYSHRFVQHASADIFLQRYLRHCKRQTQGWKSSSNGIERIFSFPWSLPYWMPALLRTAKNILRASWKTCRQKGKNQSVWYRWTKALESSWKSLRHGSASIFPNVFRMWARRKSPTDSWFMTSRTEGLMKRWHRWRQQEWLRNTAADAHSWYSFRFRHHR